MSSYLRLFALTAAAFLAVSCGASSSPPAVHPLVAENQIRALEIPLARKPDIYSVFNLGRRAIQIKIRGSVLREFQIRGLNIHKSWKFAAELKTLMNKGISPEPRRTVIRPPKNPGEQDDDTESVMIEKVEDSLEIEDMPDFFTVEFEDKSKILVLSRTSSSLGFFRRFPNLGIRSLFFLKRLASPRAAAATVILTPDDARALYWALFTDQKIIVSSPIL